MGYTYEVIAEFLAKLHGITMCVRTLKNTIEPPVRSVSDHPKCQVEVGCYERPKTHRSFRNYEN